MKLIQSLKSATALGMIALLVSPCSALAPAMTRIGVAGGVRGPVTAFPPGERPIGRILASGQPLFLNEKVTTGPRASLQVMLVDETVFTIGANSSMVLDEFVYDPASHSGKVTATVTNGVFRFVTGQIGHKKPSDMKVKFPVGTMGIRGTIVAGEVTATGVTAVLLGPGPATNAPGERVGAFNLANAGASVDVVKPGYSTHIDGPNGIPTPPVLLTHAQIDGLLGNIAGSALQGTPTAKPAEPAASQDPAAAPADQSNQEEQADQSGTNQPATSGGLSDYSSSDDNSGQSDASASGDLSNTQSVASLNADVTNTATFAAFDIGDNDLAALLASAGSTWDDVRLIQTGTGQYSGVGSFNMTTCAGGCVNPSGTMDFVMNIDFGKQIIGGSVAGAATASRLIVNASNNGVPIIVNDTVNFAPTSFAALSGAAQVSGTSGTGTSATVSLVNVGGIAGGAAVQATYNNGGNIGSGNMVTPRTDCTSGGCK